jgi:hypothetical protein
MGTNPKGYFLGGMGMRSLVVFQSKKVGFFFNFSKNYSFGGVGSGVWRKHVGFFFFFSFVVW